VHINSPGGDVFDGIAIYNALANHAASVTTYIDGLAASAASFIAQAGSPVKIARNASMMIHDAEGICVGNCAAMLEMADLLDAASNNIADIYSRSGGTVPQWRDRMKATTWYHNGQDAVDAGLANEVYEPDQNGNNPDSGASSSVEDVVDRSVVGTNTVLVTYRPENTACPTHHTATVDSTWDANVQTSNLPTPIPLADVKKVYAWYDNSRVENDEIPKDGCKLPHHMVGTDGTPGDANLPGCRNALSRLSQSDIPDSEQEACRAHLQAHLDDEEQSEGEGTETDVLSVAVGMTLDASMLRSAFTTALVEAEAPPFDVEQFRLTMATVAANCPAVAVDAPPLLELPPMPAPDNTIRCECGRPIHDGETSDADHVIDPATMRHIMNDAANNAPAMPDQTLPVVASGDHPVISIDMESFTEAIRRGLSS
jgi:hypothetical protein